MKREEFDGRCGGRSRGEEEHDGKEGEKVRKRSEAKELVKRRWIVEQ